MKKQNASEMMATILFTVLLLSRLLSIPIAAEDRKGLERQLRYMGRPPLSAQRLSQASDGRLIVDLKTPWSDGTTRLVMEPASFLSRPTSHTNTTTQSTVHAIPGLWRSSKIPKMHEKARFKNKIREKILRKRSPPKKGHAIGFRNGF